MAVLVDTSVWVDHFKNRNNKLVNLLLTDQTLTHPMIVAELACGTPPAPRERTLGDINQLLKIKEASLEEVVDLINREKLYGLGCGLVDLCLLASTLLTPEAQLWTLDKRLHKLAGRFNVGFTG